MVVYFVENNGFLLKSVSYFRRNYVVVDQKFKSEDGIYWINRIWRNRKVIFETIEKTDVDKNPDDLKKELLSYMGCL